MPVNPSDKTRDYATALTAKPASGSSYVDMVIAGRVAIEQTPDQAQPTAMRPREQDPRIK